MALHTEAQASAWAAMQALPRPVTREAALAATEPVLAPLGLQQQFVQWWDQNGAAVLRRLNG